jgi:hypothetical protein
LKLKAPVRPGLFSCLRFAKQAARFAGVLRNLITNRAPDCQCRQYAVLETGEAI